MRLKALSGILAIMVVTEGFFILWNRHSINRFKAVDADGYVAFDSATGQICRTFQTSARLSKQEVSPSLNSPAESRSRDPILDAMQDGSKDAQARESADAEFVRRLPSCADIH